MINGFFEERECIEVKEHSRRYPASGYFIDYVGWDGQAEVYLHRDGIVTIHEDFLVSLGSYVGQDWFNSVIENERERIRRDPFSH